MGIENLQSLIENLRLLDPIEMQNLLHVNASGFISSAGVFLAIVIFAGLFFNHRVFTFKVFSAWLLASLLTFFYMLDYNVGKNELSISINAFMIVLLITNIIMLVCYIFSLIFHAPSKKPKNYGWHILWVAPLGFIVRVAFYSVFLIALFVLALYFY